MKRLVFINHFHNGDIHLTRNLVKYFISKLPNCEFVYSHKNAPNLLADIEGLKYDRDICEQWPITLGIEVHGDIAYINTWVGADNHAYNQGCTIQSYYNLFNHYNQVLFKEPQLSPLEDFVPTIDYSEYRISKTKQFFQYRSPDGIDIFVSNGDTGSGQASNFNMNGFITDLAQTYINNRFFVTNIMDDRIQLDNVFYTQDIMGTEGKNDLNENSYLSTYCDIIIGRSSGTFTFAFTQDNFNSDKIYYSVLSSAGFNGCNLLTTKCKFVDIYDLQDLKNRIKEDI
jgi:hypothetical protein